MVDKKESELNSGAEVVFLEEEIGQSSKAIASFLLSRISSTYGATAGPNIARGFFNLDKKLEEHLEEFPGANKDLVKQVLEAIAAELREKS